MQKNKRLMANSKIGKMCYFIRFSIFCESRNKPGLLLDIKTTFKYIYAEYISLLKRGVEIKLILFINKNKFINFLLVTLSIANNSSVTAAIEIKLFPMLIF